MKSVVVLEQLIKFLQYEGLLKMNRKIGMQNVSSSVLTFKLPAIILGTSDTTKPVSYYSEHNMKSCFSESRPVDSMCRSYCQ